MDKTRLLVRLSLMTALITVVTMYVSVPVPNVSGAYINAGDAVIFASAYLFGPLGAVSAAVGSALADILVGSAFYAPATFVIKGGMALLAALLMKRWKKLYAVLAAGLVMPLGYFLYESVMFGVPAGAAGIVFNLIQYAAGAALGYAAMRVLEVKRNG